MATDQDRAHIWKYGDDYVIKTGKDAALKYLDRTIMGTYVESANTEELEDTEELDVTSMEQVTMERKGKGWILSEDDFPTIVGMPTLDGFLVPDHPNDAFKRAREEDPFAHDTHEAVRAFEEWVPTSEGGKRFKRTVATIEERARTNLDEQRFQRGEATD